VNARRPAFDKDHGVCGRDLERPVAPQDVVCEVFAAPWVGAGKAGVQQRCCGPVADGAPHARSLRPEIVLSASTIASK